MKKANEGEKNSICSSCRCAMYINVEKLSRTFYNLSYDALHLIVTLCKGGSGMNRPEMFLSDLGSRWHNRPRNKYVFIIQIKTTALSSLRNKILECFYHLQFKATLQREFLAFIVLNDHLNHTHSFTWFNKFWPSIYEGHFFIRKLVYLVFFYIYPQDNHVLWVVLRS